MILDEINVKELNKLFKENKDFILLDVRTDNEVAISRINGSVHIPMNEIPHRLSELDKSKNIIVQCKLGQRSAKVCHYLLDNGFSHIKNLSGGIVAWSKEIDPTISIL